MLLFVSAVILVIADQISKLMTLEFLKPIGSKSIIDGVLSLTYVENRGAAFGILQNSRWVFILITVAVTAAIVYYIIKYKPQSRMLRISLALILSGAAGNLIDRIFRGYVVDMIEVTFIDYPVFNFADCCVVIGAVLLAAYVIFIYKEPKKEENE